jgi:diguanylate cyclase (GGDEF)-like protein
VGAVIAAGGPLVVAAALQDMTTVNQSLAEFWILVGFVALGELLPVELTRLDGDGEITTSTIFSFAVLIRFGLWPAILAQVLASIGADLAQRKPVWKAMFNASQYSLSVGAGGLTLMALTRASDLNGLRFFEGADLAGILSAGAVFFVLNNVLTRTAIALDQGVPIVRFFREGMSYQVAVNGVLLALSPIAVVAAERSLILLPLLALPMAIVYKSAAVYAEKEYKAYQAMHDGLTGLPNRVLFYDRAEQAIREGHRTGVSAALMLIDLDRFKEVNDSLGHHIGDSLLKRIGPRLRQTLRESDTVARLGGDEFAVVLLNVADRDSAGHIATKLLRSLEVPFLLDEVSEDLTLDVEASIGVVLCPDDGEDVDVLMQRADVAMYSAKDARTGFEFYSGDRDTNSPKQLALLGDLRRGIESGNLFLDYQPQFDMATGGMVAAEALLRWRHPKYGMVPPDEFIVPAERTGLIRTLTMYSLERALAQWREWDATGTKLRVAVNLSRANLLNLRFPDELAALLSAADVPPSQLELEITESAIMADPGRAQDVLEKLSGMGIALTLDDFGAGYSSLAYLKRLPVGAIKIDKSFVIGMPVDENDFVIVSSTIDLARNLGLKVVAEGVESAVTWNRLKELGCDMAQGYWTGRPVAPEEIGSAVAIADVGRAPF